MAPNSKHSQEKYVYYLFWDSLEMSNNAKYAHCHCRNEDQMKLLAIVTWKCGLISMLQPRYITSNKESSLLMFQNNRQNDMERVMNIKPTLKIVVVLVCLAASYLKVSCNNKHILHHFSFDTA